MALLCRTQEENTRTIFHQSCWKSISGIMELLIRRPLHEPINSRPALRPPRHRRLWWHLPGSSEGVAMEGLMLEILISLCQTGAHIYGMALATIGLKVCGQCGLKFLVCSFLYSFIQSCHLYFSNSMSSLSGMPSFGINWRQYAQVSFNFFLISLGCSALDAKISKLR